MLKAKMLKGTAMDDAVVHDAPSVAVKKNKLLTKLKKTAAKETTETPRVNSTKIAPSPPVKAKSDAGKAAPPTPVKRQGTDMKALFKSSKQRRGGVVAKKKRKPSIAKKISRRYIKCKEEMAEHGRGYQKLFCQVTVWLGSLVGVFAYFSNMSGCSVIEKLVVVPGADSTGDGFLACGGQYGAYFACIENEEKTWNCIRRYELCVPHSWSIGIYTDPACLVYDQSITDPRLKGKRPPNEFETNFTYVDKSFPAMEFYENYWLPELSKIEPSDKIFPPAIIAGLSVGSGGIPQDPPPQYLAHDYFYGTYQFGLKEIGGIERPDQFFQLPVLTCSKVAYTVTRNGEEVKQSKYIRVDPWCEEGEIQPGTHERKRVSTGLYFVVPKRVAAGVAGL